MSEGRAALANSVRPGWVISVPFHYREQTTNARTLARTHTLSLKGTFHFWRKWHLSVQLRPPPPRGLHHFWVETGGPRKTLPTSLRVPASLGRRRGGRGREREREREMRVALGSRKSPRAASPVSGKAMATAAAVASALTTAAGRREGTVTTAGSVQLLRRQVPWIRKLGQAPGIGGEGGARANQRPPRADRKSVV